MVRAIPATEPTKSELPHTWALALYKALNPARTSGCPTGCTPARDTVTEVGATTVGIDRDGGSICEGDVGGTAPREKDGGVELAAVHSASWQAGCLWSDETRSSAVETGLDDIVD